MCYWTVQSWLDWDRFEKGGYWLALMSLGAVRPLSFVVAVAAAVGLVLES